MGSEHLAHAVVEFEARSSLVEARGGGEPGILFVLVRDRNGRGQRGHDGSLRLHYASAETGGAALNFSGVPLKVERCSMSFC